jgi:hypothetical protein
LSVHEIIETMMPHFAKMFEAIRAGHRQRNPTGRMILPVSLTNLTEIFVSSP